MFLKVEMKGETPGRQHSVCEKIVKAEVINRQKKWKEKKPEEVLPVT